MKFVVKQVSQNNDKYVAEFVSEDQTSRLFIAGNNASDFSKFTVGQSYTLTEV